jgi:hypothetical protein
MLLEKTECIFQFFCFVSFFQISKLVITYKHVYAVRSRLRNIRFLEVKIDKIKFIVH